MNSSIAWELFRFLKVKAKLDESIGMIRMHEEVRENHEFLTDLRRENVDCIMSPDVALKMEEIVLSKTNLAPALPIESLEQGFLQLGFSEGEGGSLFEHTEFATIAFQSHQLCLLRDYAGEGIKHPVSARNLATLFNMNERTVYRTLRQRLQQPGPLARHNALDEESEHALVAMLLGPFAP
jgi:hypothetical protein